MKWVFLIGWSDFDLIFIIYSFWNDTKHAIHVHRCWHGRGWWNYRFLWLSTTGVWSYSFFSNVPFLMIAISFLHCLSLYWYVPLVVTRYLFKPLSSLNILRRLIVPTFFLQRFSKNEYLWLGVIIYIFSWVQLSKTTKYI